MNFNTTDFTLGSTVTSFGVEGEVIEVNFGGFVESATVGVLTGYILVKFNDKRETFTLDGKLESWHKEPSLKLVRRAEEFEEVVGYQAIVFINSMPWISDCLYETKEAALSRVGAIGYREVKYMRRKV